MNYEEYCFFNFSFDVLSGILSRILGSFSITSNVRTLASFDRDPDEISCLYGIRFLTALWICIGNAYLYNAIWPRVAGSDGSVICKYDD